MHQDIKFFVGPDVHKDTISVSVCEAGSDASQFRGTIRHDVPTLFKVLRKLGAPAATHATKRVQGETKAGEHGNGSGSACRGWKGRGGANYSAACAHAFA